MKHPKKVLTVLVPLELYAQLKERAEKNHYTLSAYVRQILKRYLRHLETCPEGEDWWWVKKPPAQ